MSSVSTHVLDAALGRPAAGMEVTLGSADGAAWTALTAGVTDADGRIRFADEVPAGAYRLTFATGAWFAAQERETFHPEVVVAFTVVADDHHHVALLLSPFSYTTYRGS